MSDDPKDIASFLIGEHGLDRAREIALEGTTTANERRDYYDLSIWREVRGILREMVETAD